MFEKYKKFEENLGKLLEDLDLDIRKTCSEENYVKYRITGKECVFELRVKTGNRNDWIHESLRVFETLKMFMDKEFTLEIHTTSHVVKREKRNDYRN